MESILGLPLTPFDAPPPAAKSPPKTAYCRGPLPVASTCARHCPAVVPLCQWLGLNRRIFHVLQVLSASYLLCLFARAPLQCFVCLGSSFPFKLITCVHVYACLSLMVELGTGNIPGRPAYRGNAITLNSLRLRTRSRLRLNTIFLPHRFVFPLLSAWDRCSDCKQSLWIP